MSDSAEKEVQFLFHFPFQKRKDCHSKISIFKNKSWHLQISNFSLYFKQESEWSDMETGSEAGDNTSDESPAKSDLKGQTSDLEVSKNDLSASEVDLSKNEEDDERLEIDLDRTLTQRSRLDSTARYTSAWISTPVTFFPFFVGFLISALQN